MGETYFCFFFFMIRRPPRSTLPDTLVPYTTLFRSRAQTMTSAQFGVTALPYWRTRSRLEPRTMYWSAKDVARPISWGSNIRKRTSSMRSEEHTSDLQSLMRISYAVFCLKKKKKTQEHGSETDTHQSSQKKHLA